MTVAAWFAEALAHHQAGRLDAAEPLYRRILGAEPGHSDAWHLLGVLIHQRGRSEEAVGLVTEAIRLNGGIADYHGNLGTILQSLGRLEEAVVSQRRAIGCNPDSASAHFNLALALAALVRREEAVVEYAEAARLQPTLADAHLNLGALLHELGRPADALAAHDRAAALLPADPRPWSNRAASLHALGRVEEAAEAIAQALARGGSADAGSLAVLASTLHAQGRLADAADAYVEALRLTPQDARLLNNFGLLLRAMGQGDDAATCFDAATALMPDLAEAHDNLGSLRLSQGRAAEAERHHLAALARRPDFPGAWNNLGNARRTLGQGERALPCWRNALALDPGQAETWSNLGNALREAERMDGAESCHRRAVRLAPGLASANNNYGYVLQGRLRPAEAAHWFRRALALDPAYGEAWSNLGLARQRSGEPSAERGYDRALLLNPDLGLARFNRGLLRLEQGDLGEGWPGYGWRFSSGQVGRGRQPAIPPWRGEDPGRLRLLVWGEQGVGDTILFASMLDELVGRAREVVVEVDRRLVPLFARSFPKARVRAESIDAAGREAVAVPGCDRHVPMGSLARVFRASLAGFPPRSSWLVPDGALVSRWAERVSALPRGLKVGIAWRSQMITEERRAAYLPLDRSGPLFALAGVQFVNLQYGEVDEEIRAAERRFGVRLCRWADLDLKDDFEGVAALIANLDLVISPAMSVGELAGAIGVPVWRFGTRDWTQLGTRVRPWFPSQRLFQPRPNEGLEEVVAGIAGELGRMAGRAPIPPALPRHPGGSGDDRAGAVSMETAETGRRPSQERAAPLLAQALRFHQSGDLANAEQFYRQILDIDPDHADALHLLGVLAHQLDRNDVAEALIGRALGQCGTVAEYHGNYGSVLQALGRLPEAVASYERALALKSDYPDALNNLGSALQAMGRLAEAEVRYRGALSRRPGYPQALANLGTVLHALGRREEALASLREALARDAGLIDARLALGALLGDLGRVGEAEAEYRAALSLADDAEAHAGLGQLLFRTGRTAAAAASLERAVQLGLRRAAAIDLLGVARRMTGDPAAAERWHRMALSLEPERVGSRTNLGLALAALGRAGAAADSHRRGLALEPASVDALNNLGIVLQGLDGTAAAAILRRAVQVRPARPESWGNLGTALLGLRRFAESAAASERALALAPALGGALTTRGAALKGGRRFAEAVAGHRRALHLRPDHAVAWSNLGTALAGLSRWGEAVTATRRALALSPALVDAHTNLGHAAQVQGRTAEAERCVERTLRLVPDRAPARMNRALLRLARGDLGGGWADYSFRFTSGEATARRFPVPEWRGESLTGRTLLAWAEQGLGDEIMFGTLLPDLMRRVSSQGGRLIVECEPRLVRLFAGALPGALVRAPQPDPRDCDLHAPFGSIAGLLRPTVASFAVTPSEAGWLRPDRGLAEAWRNRLATLGSGLTLGIAWRSGLITAERAGAYSRLDQWGALFAVPGIRFVNLQYGDCAAELEQAERRFGVVIRQWPDLDLKRDIDSVAALVAGLDLVVCGPTSVGELAAAVGTPVWRLSGAGDWSALGTRVRPWFPAMALVPPDGPGGFEAALSRVAGRLKKLMVS